MLALVSSHADELALNSATPGQKIHAIHHSAHEPNGRSPVLFLHSFHVPCSKAFDLTNESWMRELGKEGFDTWAIDLPGFGLSKRTEFLEGTSAVEQTLDDLNSVISHIQSHSPTHQVTLIGWGWGGLVAAKAAVSNPTAIDRLVLLGVMDGFSALAPNDFVGQFATLDGGLQVTTQTLLADWSRMLRGIEDEVLADAASQLEALVTQCGKGSLVLPTGVARDMANAWANQLPFEPADIKTPTLVIRGDHDGYASGFMDGKIPHSRVVVLHNATHWVMYEKGQTFLQLQVSNFLALKKSQILH